MRRIRRACPSRSGGSRPSCSAASPWASSSCCPSSSRSQEAVMSEVPDTGAEAPQSAAAKLFDLRVLIGGLFLLYGVMLTVAGLFTSSKELAKASHINMWMALAMLVIGAFFPTWWRPRPLQRPEPDQPKAYETGTSR